MYASPIRSQSHGDPSPRASAAICSLPSLITLFRSASLTKSSDSFQPGTMGCLQGSGLAAPAYFGVLSRTVSRPFSSFDISSSSVSAVSVRVSSRANGPS